MHVSVETVECHPPTPAKQRTPATVGLERTCFLGIHHPAGANHCLANRQVLKSSRNIFIATAGLPDNSDISLLPEPKLLTGHGGRDGRYTVDWSYYHDIGL